VLRQVPTALEIVGILLVAGGVALHREADVLPDEPTRQVTI
jgi:hypothetical protein